MDATREQEYPGRRLGLPQTGVNSTASMALRSAAFLIDLALAFGIALLFTRPELPKNWSILSWAVLTVVPIALFGSTPGQAALGLRVAPVGGDRLVGLWAIPRAALTFLVVPVLITDADGRGLHDRLCRTVVVRTR